MYIYTPYLLAFVYIYKYTQKPINKGYISTRKPINNGVYIYIYI